MCSDASRTQNTECQYPSCQRGVWQDPDGSYSAYCGASHRDTMRQRSGGLLPVASSVSFCKHCASRPVYIQDGKEHDFCGIRCSNAFREGTENPASPRSATPALTASSSVCKLSMCQKLTYDGPTGEPSEYCGNVHRLSVPAPLVYSVS
ncbi:hypothetical protein C8Q72DRAFT_193777 [Fomitopsis betulina]|nr:hypothetical protein C8Q72DRAFT_193777 [Fomitopsis betulina]